MECEGERCLSSRHPSSTARIRVCQGAVSSLRQRQQRASPRRLAPKAKLNARAGQSSGPPLTAKQTKHRWNFPPPHETFRRRSKVHWSHTRVAFSVLHCMQNPGSAPTDWGGAKEIGGDSGDGGKSGWVQHESERGVPVLFHARAHENAYYVFC